MRVKTLCAVFLLFACARTTSVAAAAAAAQIMDDRARLDFPNSITFEAAFQGNLDPASVVLEYGTTQLTCGSVIAKAVPEVDAAGAHASWTWDMRRSGSLPPGATIWWRWRYTDSAGVESLSEQRTVTWLDSEHAWQTRTEAELALHWYAGDESFAAELLDAARGGLERLEQQAGLRPDPGQLIDLYIYANTHELREAVLYEPGWTGGLAYPDHNVVIIGISERDLDWGRDAIAHELTHVLVGRLTFSCLGGVPTWLNEGLAVYSEGELDPASQSQLDQAVRDDSLLSIRSLSVGFSEVPDKAYLSYSQSYSVVRFLIEAHGQERMDTLLGLLRDGSAIDAALTEVYGFDVEGLEDAWRAALGAAPRAIAAQATAQPTPTFVPTIVPVSGGRLLVTPTPFVVPTSSTGGANDSTQPAGPPLSLTLALLGICCVLLLIAGVLVLGIIVGSQNRKAGNDG
jgi:hypothetical protein